MEVTVQDLFVEVKKVVSDYQAQAEELETQERELKGELEALQQEHTATILDQETANVSERVYLRIKAKEIISRTDVIKTILEELEEEKAQLKLSYVPLLREAQAKDGKALRQYDPNAIVDQYRYQMLSEIAEIGKQMQTQYYAIAPDLMEIVDDPKVNEVHPRVKYQFESDNYKPTYWEATKTVVHSDDVRLACSGNLPANLRIPKDVV